MLFIDSRLAGLLVFSGHRPAVCSRIFAAIFNEKHNEANGEGNAERGQRQPELELRD
jgi:hypothetical protein